jgi:hypothetical protein
LAENLGRKWKMQDGMGDGEKEEAKRQRMGKSGEEATAAAGDIWPSGQSFGGRRLLLLCCCRFISKTARKWKSGEKKEPKSF